MDYREASRLAQASDQAPAGLDELLAYVIAGEDKHPARPGALLPLRRKENI